MKKQIFLLVLISISIIVRSQDINDQFIAIAGYIHFIGDWEGEEKPEKGHRSLSNIPINAIIENGVISIDIWDTVDNITFKIINENGSTIYSTSFWINESIQYSIPIEYFPKGNYQLSIFNKRNGHVCGWFKIE